MTAGVFDSNKNVVMSFNVGTVNTSNTNLVANQPILPNRFVGHNRLPPESNTGSGVLLTNNQFSILGVAARFGKHPSMSAATALTFVPSYYLPICVCDDIPECIPVVLQGFYWVQLNTGAIIAIGDIVLSTANGLAISGGVPTGDNDIGEHNLVAWASSDGSSTATNPHFVLVQLR